MDVRREPAHVIKCSVRRESITRSMEALVGTHLVQLYVVQPCVIRNGRSLHNLSQQVEPFQDPTRKAAYTITPHTIPVLGCFRSAGLPPMHNNPVGSTGLCQPRFVPSVMQVGLRNLCTDDKTAERQVQSHSSSTSACIRKLTPRITFTVGRDVCLDNIGPTT